MMPHARPGVKSPDKSGSEGIKSLVIADILTKS
jgi:hypothetical protein